MALAGTHARARSHVQGQGIASVRHPACATSRKNPARIPRWLDAVRARWHHGPACLEGVWHEESRADGRCDRGPRHHRCRVQRQRNAGGQPVRRQPEEQRSKRAGRCTSHRRATSRPRSTRRRSTTRCRSSTSSAACCARCCRPKPFPSRTAAGELQPDLATDLPAVSDDGLTYTFTIKPGIMYAPPLQDVEITAQDFIRALERESDPKASCGRIPVLLLRDRRVRRLRCGQGRLHHGHCRRPTTTRLMVKITAAGGRPAVALRDAGDRPDPAEPGRPRGASRRGRGSHEELRAVPRRAAVRTCSRGARTWTSPCRRRTRSPSRATSRALDRPGPQPFVRSRDRRSAPGVPGSDRGDDRRRPCRPLQQGA